MLSMLGKIFSRRNIEIIFVFLYFFQKRGFCIFHVWMKNKKNIINLSSAELAYRVTKVNDIILYSNKLILLEFDVLH